jgi:small subunit ribosomal protein S9
MAEIINTIGRRKTSVARIYMQSGAGNVLVNGRDYKTYFPTFTLQYKVQQPFMATATEGQFDVNVNVQGGGFTGQVEAVRLAISRALIELDPQLKPQLKEEKLTTRDSRKVERKKPGRKKARKKFQFSKR